MISNKHKKKLNREGGFKEREGARGGAQFATYRPPAARWCPAAAEALGVRGVGLSASYSKDRDAEWFNHGVKGR